MIFGRRKRAEQAASQDEATPEAVSPDGSSPEEASTDEEAGAGGSHAAGIDGDAADGPDLEPGAEEPGADQPGADEPGLDEAALDAAEWRNDGPFDVRELHDEDDPDDGQPRIDLGSLVLTGVPGSELRLQVSEDTQEIVSAMLVLQTPVRDAAGRTGVASSALELSAYAAPRSGGLWTELRTEISEAAAGAGGSASLGEGPFGVELRRLIPVTTPEGEQGYQPSRMWVAEGPRWLLRGIVYGQAAIEEDLDDPAVAAVIGAFRAVVVRRTDEAMAPGDLLPLSMPSDLQPAG